MASIETFNENYRAFDKKLNLSIPFVTHSDALLASLVLTHDAAASTIDLFLTLLRDPTFFPAEVTLGATDDIYLRVAEHRRKLIVSPERSADGTLSQTEASSRNQDRSSSSVTHSATSLVEFPWHIILDDLVGIFEHARTTDLHVLRAQTLKRSPDRTAFNKAIALNSDLWSLSLVQRSWSHPARKAIGRVCCIPDMEPETLMRTLRDPLVGPWTREFAIMHLDYMDDKWPVRVPLPSNSTDLFRCLLRRVPNVQSFWIMAAPFLGKDLTAILPALAISELPSLKELRLLNTTYGFIGNIPALLSCLCNAVTRFPMLGSITLSGWARDRHDEENWFDDLTTYPDRPGSATGLEKSIWSAIKFFSCVDCRVFPFLSLVRRPESVHSWAWECFRFLEDCATNLGLIRVITPYLSDAQTVEAHFNPRSRDYIHALTTFCAACTHVRFFFLDIVSGYCPVPSHFMSALPDTVEEIMITCQKADDEAGWDKTASQLVASSKKLRRLSLRIQARHPDGSYNLIQYHLPQTEAMCQERNVVFKSLGPYNCLSQFPKSFLSHV
ncbi:hypothetical protein DFH11DRAFT_554984 [Phellopilus nigrolimitatus]|nr:hypothetical protein DFH11DRAFT_554984 [Phellopilus nigrolimitatus]